MTTAVLLQVLAYMYNWSKDRVEDLSKLMTQLGVWLCSRSSFLCGAYLQKMSLFHNQPLSRKLKTQVKYGLFSVIDFLIFRAFLIVILGGLKSSMY